MKRKILFCIITTSLIGLSGCSSISAEDTAKAPVPTYEPSSVSEKEVYDTFIAAAQNVDKSLQIYTEVNNAAKQEELTYEKIRQANWRVNYVPSGLGRKTSFTWDGPIRPLLSQIAKDVSYKIKFVGDLPPVPATISIVAQDTKIIDVLRDIAAKTDGLVDINIHEDNNQENRVIEVKYVDRFK